MAEIIHADCVEAMQAMEPDSVDAIVCDPPYSLGFMSKPWDMQVDHQAWATEALRVLKPGGHLLAAGGTRTFHRLVCALEDAGFEIRDCIAHMYGSGFPKSHNLPNGLGTALKPAFEPWTLARKPLVGTVAANVLEFSTGALNIDGCRVAADYENEPGRGPGWLGSGKQETPDEWQGPGEKAEGSTVADRVSPLGRWPANVTLSHLPECKQTECVPSCPVAELDRQSGESRSPSEPVTQGGRKSVGGLMNATGDERDGLGIGYGDTGGASRFFYVAKASRAERNAGLEGFEERLVQSGMGGDMPTDDQGRDRDRFKTRAANVHPTVKPIALMRWLVRLVTPKGGTVLDPFTGSGSTGVAAVLEGFDFVGIEREAEYVALAEARVKFWAQFPGADVDKVLLSDARAREIEASGQLGLL